MLSRAVGRSTALVLMAALILCAAVFLPAQAHGATRDVGIKPPTARKNGDALVPAELASYQLYKDGVASGAALPATIAKVAVPACAKAAYTITVTDTGGLVSDISDPYPVVPDAGCAPGKVLWLTP